MVISAKSETLKVVICHAPQDTVRAYRLYHLIRRQGVSPWLAEEDLRAGQEVIPQTSQAIRFSHVVLIGLSRQATEQNGPFWREFKQALDAAQEQREGAIFIIPVRFEECEVPQSLQPLHPVDLFKADGYERLTKSLAARADELNIHLTPSTETATTETDPYLGLAAFKEANAAFFFGREAFVNQLEKAVLEKLFVAVIGPSGSGKSSVVFAGLIPRLREQGKWQMAEFRPGPTPFRALAAALLPLLESGLDELERLKKLNNWENSLKQGEVTLPQLVGRYHEKQPDTALLLVADQFEELYTLCQDTSERQAFLDSLLAAIQPPPPGQRRPRFRLVLTLRADFFGYALLHKLFADADTTAKPNLTPMEPEDLRRAVERPAWRLGVEIEPGLTERILRAVQEEPGNLPLLEFALTQLWERRERMGEGGYRLTNAAYDAIGGVEQAIAQYAETEFANLSEAEQQQAQRIFTQLVQPGAGTQDTRRIALRREIGEDSWTLVQRLASARLVVTGRDEANKQETFEIVHEALIGSWWRLQEWMSVDRAFRIWQERLRAALHQWEINQYDEGSLLRGVSLDEALGWIEKKSEVLNKEERKYIEISQELRDRERLIQGRQHKRTRILLITALVIFTVIISFAVFTATQAIQSTNDKDRYEQVLTGVIVHSYTAEAKARIRQDESAKSFSRQLAYTALNVSSTDIELALLLDVEALKASETVEARNSLEKLLKIEDSADVGYLITQACNRAGRNMTWDEWQTYIGDGMPQPTCLENYDPSPPKTPTVH